MIYINGAVTNFAIGVKSFFNETKQGCTLWYKYGIKARVSITKQNKTVMASDVIIKAMCNLALLGTTGLAMSCYAAYKYSFYPKTMVIVAAINILGFIVSHDLKNLNINISNTDEEKRNVKKLTREQLDQRTLKNVWTAPLIKLIN